MNDLLTDWYFTRCVNLLKEQASDLLIDLQRLRLDTLQPARHVSAVQRILAADHQVGVYALPALLDVMVRDVSIEAAGAAAQAVATIASDGTERAVGAAVADLVDLVRSIGSGLAMGGREVQDAVAGLDVLAAAAAHQVLVEEHTPYFGLTSQQLHVALLALASCLAGDPGVAAALAPRLASVVDEQPEGVLAEVVLAAATGAAGRLPLRLGVELVVLAVDPEAGRRLLASAHNADDGVNSFEPDLLQTAAVLQPDPDSLLDEVLYLRGLTTFLRGEPAGTRPTAAVVRRLGIHVNDTIVLRAQIWQTATLGRAIAQPERYAGDLAALLEIRRSPDHMVVAPPGQGDRDWAPLASALAEVSGGRWLLTTAGPRDKKVSTRAAATVVASPWLRAHKEKGSLHYTAIRRLSGVLRLALPSLAAARELSSPEVADDEQADVTRTALAGLVLVADAMLEPELYRVWAPLVVAARLTLEELTTGHVGSVSPERLYDWIDAVNDKLQAGRPGQIGELMGAQVVARPLAWAHAILPHLDEAGPSRWAPEMVDLVEFELDDKGPGPVDVRALVLNDVLRRFGRPYSHRPMPVQPVWQKMYRQPTLDHHKVLLSPTTSLEEWLLERRKKPTAAAAAALAIRRLEALGTDDQPRIAATFAELTDEMAVVLRQRDRARDHFHVLVRAVALLDHPAVRESTARVEQVAGVGIVSDEPTIWRYVFDRALEQEAPLGDEEGTIRRLLAGALRRLLSMKPSDATTERLRTIWRDALDRAVQRTPEAERTELRDLLIEAADLHGAGAAGFRAVAQPVAQTGLDRRRLRAVETGVAGAAWLTRGLVLDPVDDAHVAFVDGRDTRGVSSQFPPRRRPRNSLGTVVSLTEQDGVSTAILNVGESDLWSVLLRGRVPASETLSIGDPVAAVLKNDRRSFRMLLDQPGTGRPTAVRLEAYRESAELSGRILQLRVRGQGAQAVDHRLWDADTARAFSGRDDETADVVAVYDAELDWLPFVRDGLALVVQMVTTGAPTTLVLNSESADGWVFSTAPGEVYGLRRSDIGLETVAAFERLLGAHDDPNGLLVTFVLGAGLTLELWDGDHSTDVHGALTCPVDDRNLRWRRAVDEHLDGVLLAPEEGVWQLRVTAPAAPFPSAISLTVERPATGRRAARDEAQFIAPNEFDPHAQRTGHLRARVEPANSLGEDPAAVFAEFFAHEDVTVELRNVIRYTPDGWVMCATTNGIVVMLRPESMSLVPLDPDVIRTLDVRGRQARLGGLRPARHETWTAVTGAAAGLLRDVLERATGPLVGLVWSVRRGARTAGPVAVKFDVPGYPNVAIDLGVRSVRAGSIVAVRAASEFGGVEVSVASTFRIGDLLFPDLAPGEPVDGCVYVGHTAAAGTTTGVVQTSGGAVLTADVPSDVPLFSVRQGGQWRPPRRQWESSCRVERGADGGRTQWVLISGDAGAIGGVVTRELAVGPAAVRRARIVVRRRLGQVVLGRELDVVNVRMQRTTSSPLRRPRTPVDVASVPDIAAELDRLASRGEPVEVEVEPQDLDRAHVTELVQLGCRRSEAALAVVDAEPVLISAVDYETAGLGRLVATGADSYGISFREVPDLDLEALAAHLGAPYGEEVRPRRLLYAMEHNGRHVFEFGFGLRASAEGAQLRFDDQPFDEVKRVLFHGDQVGGVVFTRVEGETVMVIREAWITASAGTTLYRQAAELKFLHLLRVEREGGALRVRQIEGFSRARTDESRSFLGPQVALAVLDTGAEDLDVTDGASRLIYGELDTKRFLDSAGLQVVFHHRTLTAEGLAAIGHGVVTFVKGGRIKRFGNEVLLAVRSASDRASDLDGSARVIRRNFSVDVNQLPRLQDFEGERALAGSLLVGWVREEAAQRAGVEVRLCGPTIPSRSTRSLRDLALAQDGAFLLVDELGRDRDERTIRLEYRHGIYFSVRFGEIESEPGNLVRQDVVRLTVSRESGLFTLTRCSPSDRRFFETTPRPMVALPANRLLAKTAPADSRADGYWGHGRAGIAFIAGGLPGEMAAPASYAEPTGWGGGKPRELTALMGAPHPKVALFGLRGGRLSAAPAGRTTGAGALSFGRDGRVTAVVDGTHVAVDPAVLTFADIAATDLRERARAISWRFHDDSTGSWEPDGTVLRQPLEAHSVVDGGPVFFERGERLRYTTDLDRWAYSSAFLSQGVRSEDAAVRAAVAGISRAVDGRPDGLYLEVAPGVVCLVLGALLGIRLAGG